MCIRCMREAVQCAAIGKLVRTWFPRWLLRFAQHQRQTQSQAIGVEREDVIALLKRLKGEGNGRGSERR